MRAFIFLCSFFILFSVSSYARQKAPSEVGQYVNDLVDNVSSMLVDKNLSKAAKVSKSEKLLKENLNFDWMADKALGRNFKTLSESQIQEFHKLYKDYVIKAYASLVKNYNGEKTKVEKVLTINPKTMEYKVNTTVAKPGGRPINVSYEVKRENDSFKVTDIITEGVSLINTQQAEFNSVIKREGFESLLAYLKGKASVKPKTLKAA